MLIRIEATAMSMMRKGNEDQKADLKGPLEFRQHEGGRQGGDGDIFRLRRRLGMRHVQEQFEVGVANMKPSMNFFIGTMALVKPCSAW